MSQTSGDHVSSSVSQPPSSPRHHHHIHHHQQQRLSSRFPPPPRILSGRVSSSSAGAAALPPLRSPTGGGADVVAAASSSSGEGRHSASHPMQCILTRGAVDIFFAGDDGVVPNALQVRTGRILRLGPHVYVCIVYSMYCIPVIYGF